MIKENARQLPDGWDRFAGFFSALGDPTRQKILLIFEPGEEICVNEIAAVFDISRPAISHHLKVLRNAGLVGNEKRGKEVYYHINYDYCVDVLKLVHDFVENQTSGRESKVTHENAA